MLAKVGITRKLAGTSGHGLRKQRAAESYEAKAGVPPPVRGGIAPDRETDRAAREAVARLLGHSRSQITNAYLGAPAIAPATTSGAADPTRQNEVGNAS